MKVRRGIWLGLWLLSLVGISFYGGEISYGFFFGISLIPLISLLYLLCVYSRFRIFQEIRSRNMVCGQSMPYYFVLQNDSHFAFTGVSVKLFSSFSYVEELPDDREYELLPGDRFTFETKLVCRYRGEYEVGVKKIIITDFFRLFRVSYAIPGTIKALVLPRIVSVAELNSLSDVSVFRLREAANDKSEPDATVREYCPGDSVKQIQWKASAREQKLKVRNLIGEEKQGIFLFCDTKRYGREEREFLPLENKILEVFLALGMYFAERNMGFSACCGQTDGSLWQVNGLREFEAFYRNTAAITFREEEERNSRLEGLVNNGVLHQSRVVFLVLHTLEEEVLKVTEQLIAGGSIVVIYLVTDENAEEFRIENNARRRLIILSLDAELEGCL